MDDDPDDKDDTKRKSRNLSEKKRRDQFNLLVNELSSMVSSNSRKMDKSTVLKSTIAFLKSHNEIAVRSRVHEIQEDWKPSFLSNEEFTHLILEALDGFIIVFSSTGRVFYASESITSLLGHLPSDLLNMTVYDMVYEDDQTDLYNILLNPTTIVDPLQTGINKENQVSFCCYIKRGTVDYRQEVSYELVQFTGYFRSDVEMDSVLTPTRYSGYSGEADSRLIFVGTGRLLTPQLIREMSIVDSTKSEFTSRHSLEWKFLFLDHRAPPIIGYLPFEVLGTSGYDYYHFDDLEKVVTCHEALMQKGEGTSCYYRFLTKGQQWIWLQTRFYITYHQWNSKPEFVVCTHRVVSYADVMKQTRNNNGTNKFPDEIETIPGHERKQHNSSSSLLETSPWSSKSSRAAAAPVVSPSTTSNRGRHKYGSYHGTGSDSATSISKESQTGRHSSMTQNSTKSGMRSYASSQKSQHQSQQSNYIQQHMIQSQHQSYANIPSNHQLLPNPQHYQLRPSPNIISPSALIGPATFIEPQQYLATMPVQPVISFSDSNAIIPHLSSNASIYSGHNIVDSGVVLTPSQNHIQDQLQRKHEELQHMIVKQQEELRRVQQQLLMARCGILPSIVNVTLPTAPSTSNDANNRSMMYVEHNPSQQHHHISHQQQICAPSVSSEHGSRMQTDQHSLLTIGESRQGTQSRMGMSNMSVSSAMSRETDEMISYMQLTPVPISHLQQNQQQLPHQQLQLHSVDTNSIELLQYQMSQEQAQIPFNPNIEPSSPNHNNPNQSD